MITVTVSQLLTPDPETILCNSMKMLREKLRVSGEGVGVEHREREDDYVYDLYYQETVTAGWIQDILSVRPYLDEGELVRIRTQYSNAMNIHYTSMTIHSHADNLA